MSVKFAILGLLRRKSLHGYRLKVRLERDFGHMWTINFGQVYQTLGRLHADGLVTMKVEEQDVAPNRKQYTITEEGQRAFTEWLLNSPGGNPVMRDPFLLRFAFLGMDDAERAIEMIDEQIIAYRATLRLRRQEQPKRERLSVYTGLLVELGVRSNELMLEWLARAREELVAARGRVAEDADGTPEPPSAPAPAEPEAA